MIGESFDDEIQEMKEMEIPEKCKVCMWSDLWEQSCFWGYNFHNNCDDYRESSDAMKTAYIKTNVANEKEIEEKILMFGLTRTELRALPITDYRYREFLKKYDPEGYMDAEADFKSLDHFGY